MYIRPLIETERADEQLTLLCQNATRKSLTRLHGNCDAVPSLCIVISVELRSRGYFWCVRKLIFWNTMRENSTDFSTPTSAYSSAAWCAKLSRTFLRSICSLRHELIVNEQKLRSELRCVVGDRPRAPRAAKPVGKIDSWRWATLPTTPLCPQNGVFRFVERRSVLLWSFWNSNQKSLSGISSVFVVIDSPENWQCYTWPKFFCIFVWMYCRLDCSLDKL